MNSISSILTVFRRELAAYFNAAIAYIFIIVFVLLSGGLYMTQFFVVGLADMRPFFSILPFTLAVFMPAVTMRLWAEEKRGNTLELLLTFPMATHDIVIGKFLASLVFYITALCGTLTIPMMLKVLGNPDPGTIIGGYLGALLLGAFFIAIGIFISGICRDQIVAFILAMIICFGINLIGTEFLASSIDGWVPGFGSFLRNYIGSAGHFDSFMKGVFDNRDLLYFVIGSVIFLVLNGFWFEGRMKPGSKKIFAAAVVISAGIFLTSNWFFSSFSIGRFDLTEGSIYTTSDASKKILHELKAPVTVKFYISPSDKMPTGMKTLEADVIAKLDELRIASKGKLQYKIFHMEAANVVETQAEKKDESLEQQLQKKGIQPFQIRAIESDEVAVKLVYSALSIAYKEKPEEIVPRITLENLNELEYMLISKIYRMTLAETPKIALIAPYEEKKVDPQIAALMAQLGGQMQEAYREDNYDLLEMALRYEGYEVNRINLSEEQTIPEGTKTLVIMEPEKFSERQRYEVAKFLSHGGSVLLGVQNYIYEYGTMGPQEIQITPRPKTPDMNPLLSNLGFEVDEQVLVDKQHDVITLGGAARMGPFEVSIPVKVPIQILVTQTGMNPDISITSRLSPLFYLWGTGIKMNQEKIKTQNLKVDTLLSSSKESWTVTLPQGPLMPQSLELQPESRRGPFPLAVLVQGQFQDIYATSEAPAWPPKETAPPAEGETPEVNPPAPPSAWPSEQLAPGKMILVGAATLFQKHMIRSGGHLNFFLNSVDVLTLGEELVTIRSKQVVDRSLDRLSAPTKILWRFIVTLLVPIVIALIGFSRVLLRRKIKQDYLKDFALTR